MWVELQGLLQQNTSTNSFIYCKVEQELWCDESDYHPNHLQVKTTGGGVTCGGYVKVKSAPHAYDQGGEAEGENPERGPLIWLSYPQIRGIAGRGGIGWWILHLLMSQMR
jgi:hypothetical protein